MTKGKEVIHNKTMLQIRKEKWVDNKSKDNKSKITSQRRIYGGILS